MSERTLAPTQKAVAPVITTLPTALLQRKQGCT